MIKAGRKNTRNRKVFTNKLKILNISGPKAELYKYQYATIRKKKKKETLTLN